MVVRVAGIEIPESTMARSAETVALCSEPDMLFRHSCRVFLFASLIGKRRDAAFDPQLLYVASLFHNFGLSASYRTSTRRFEVDGANAARQFLTSHGVPERDTLEVWSAIALHTTFGIVEHPIPLVGLLNSGVATDLLGKNFDKMTDSQRAEIILAFPRGHGFKSLVIDALAQGMSERPETSFGTVNADVLDRCDPNFRRTNYCGLILGSEWHE